MKCGSIWSLKAQGDLSCASASVLNAKEGVTVRDDTFTHGRLGDRLYSHEVSININWIKLMNLLNRQAKARKRILSWSVNRSSHHQVCLVFCLLPSTFRERVGDELKQRWHEINCGEPWKLVKDKKVRKMYWGKNNEGEAIHQQLHFPPLTVKLMKNYNDLGFYDTTNDDPLWPFEHRTWILSHFTNQHCRAPDRGMLYQLLKNLISDRNPFLHIIFLVFHVSLCHASKIIIIIQVTRGNLQAQWIITERKINQTG